MSQSNNNSTILILGTFAMGMQKLLPSFQKIYQSWTAINAFKTDIMATVLIKKIIINLYL